MDDRVAAALDRAFPDRAVRRVDATGPSWVADNRTVRVSFADAAPLYLKVALDGDGTRIRRERGLLAYLGAEGTVPVPPLLASDPEGDPPFLATADVDARSLETAWAEADADGRADLARTLGAGLAAVHAHGFERHGHVVDGDPAGLTVDEGPWADVLLDKIDEMEAIGTTDAYAHQFDAVRAAVRDRRGLLSGAPAALVHGDSWGPNCYLTDAGTGFLDWELACVGDPARELHRVREQQLGALRADPPDRLVDALYDGYRARAGGLPGGFADRRALYDVVRFVGYAAFFDEMVGYLDAPEADLAAWMDAEFERRLDAL